VQCFETDLCHQTAVKVHSNQTVAIRRNWTYA